MFSEWKVGRKIMCERSLGMRLIFFETHGFEYKQEYPISNRVFIIENNGNSENVQKYPNV